MKKLFFVLSASFMMLTAFQCSKNEMPEATGTVKDYTGLDGCSMVIVLDSGLVLEPVELPSNTSLVADKKVSVKYQDVKRYSICMAGKTVKITSLRYL